MAVIPNYVTFRHYFGDTAAVDVDGYPPFLLSKVRSSGFDNGFTGLPLPGASLAFPLTVSVDGSANGAEAYDVWLSQRTDDPALAMFTVALVAGKSGTWTISLTPSGLSDLAPLATTTSALSRDEQFRALKYAHLYVIRHSDNAIQWVDLLAATTDDA